MADTGYKSPAATGGHNNDWADPTDAYSSNNAWATETTANQNQSYENFDFGVPAGATIDGIEVQVEGHYATAASYASIYIYSTSHGFENGKSGSGKFGTEDAYVTFGSSTDLWGLNWIASDFSDANFYLRLNAQIGEGGTMYVDHVQIKVYYTEATSIKTINGLAKASVKTINGLAIASVKTFNGLG